MKVKVRAFSEMAASSWCVLSKDNACLIKELDRSVKSGWEWDWIECEAGSTVCGRVST